MIIMLVEREANGLIKTGRTHHLMKNETDGRWGGRGREKGCILIVFLIAFFIVLPVKSTSPVFLESTLLKASAISCTVLTLAVSGKRAAVGPPKCLIYSKHFDLQIVCCVRIKKTRCIRRPYDAN